jgi:hypothetical protein
MVVVAQRLRLHRIDPVMDFSSGAERSLDIRAQGAAAGR